MSEWLLVDSRDESPFPPRHQIHFYADENLPEELDWWINLGIQDVLPVKHDNMQGGKDLRVLERATKLNRVLITLDNGFWNDTQYPLGKYSGIIMIPMSNINLDKVHETLEFYLPRFIKRLSKKDWIGAKTKLYDTGFRWKNKERELQFEFRNGLLYEKVIRDT